MDKTELINLLRAVADGNLTPDEAALKLKALPFESFEEVGDYAKVDLHRGIRQGVSEVIYGEGKAKEHILGIVQAMLEHEQSPILITRLAPEAAEYLTAGLAGLDKAAGLAEPDASSTPFTYDPLSRTGIVGDKPTPNGKGRIVVACGGTSDVPVAEEAAITAEVLGNQVTRLYDVGVSGIHRLLSNMEEVMSARVVIAVAGMEGALPSVLGGLVDCPVIAVPTSVGYGASFDGMAALLAMLNSCASGVAVVNIDNGFGAGYMASVINHLD